MNRNLDQLREDVARIAGAEGQNCEHVEVSEQLEAQKGPVGRSDIAVIVAALEVERNYVVVRLDDAGKCHASQITEGPLADVSVQRPQVDDERHLPAVDLGITPTRATTWAAR